MSSKQRCSECGAEVTAARHDGLCTRCLLELGLKAQAEPALDLRLPASFGDYELLEEIARGGMGIVYRARQMSLDRAVAVKLLLAGAFSSPENVRRFRVEASAAASLQHPNIVTIHEVGVHQGQHYLVMDYVDGPNLAKRVAQGPLPPKTAAAYLKLVAETVHFAHEQGILNRDLKPSNILLDSQDQPRVTDFGLAKRFEGDSELTVSGQLVGSPSYLPPEQAAAGRGKVSRRSDVYGLGATLYHLLTGRAPFQAATMTETLAQVLNTEAVAPRMLNPAVPRDLETICLKCLEKEPAKRYPTAQALAEELGRFLNDQPVLAQPIGPAGKAWRWCRRQPVRAGLIAAVILVSALGLVGVLWEWRAAQRSAEAEIQQRRRADEQALAAEASALLAQKHAYAADMKEVQRKLEENDLGNARELLNRHRPERKAENRKQKAELDLCGWAWRYLWARCQSEESFILCQYSHAVTAVDFSGDGKWLAVRRDDDHVVLWDAVAKKPAVEIAAAGWHKALAFSPEGSLMAWGNVDLSGDSIVSIRDVSTTNTCRDIRLSAELVSVAFSPDARQMATLAYDGRVGVWDVKTRQSLTSFLTAPVDVWGTRLRREGPGLPGDEPLTPGDTHLSPVGLRPPRAKMYTDHYGSVLFSPDGCWLAVGKAEPGIYLLECATGRSRELTVPAVADGITTLAFSPNSKLLAAAYGAGDADVHLWDLESGAVAAVAQLRGHSGWITDLAFSPDGQMLASVSTDQTLRVWDVARKIERRGPFRGHLDEVWAVAWSKDGTEIVTGGKDGSVRDWDPAAQALGPYSVVPSEVQPWGGLDFLPDRQTFLTAPPPEGAIVRWNTAKVQRLETLSFLGTNHVCLAVSRDGRWLALADGGENIQVWDFPRREMLTNLVFRGTKVLGVLFFPRGGFLNCGGYDARNRQVTKFWSVGDWREVDLPAPALQGAFELAFSPDEPRVAIGYDSGKAAWWDLVTGQRQGPPFDCDSEGFVHVAFSSDGKWFATGSRNGKITLWDVAKREAKPIGRGHRNELSHLAFSADGQRLVGAGSDPKGLIKFWDVETGRDVATLPGEPDWFCQIGFSPDGNTLFAVSVEAKALLWRAPSWEEIDAAEKKQKTP